MGTTTTFAKIKSEEGVDRLAKICHALKGLSADLDAIEENNGILNQCKSAREAKKRKKDSCK